MSESQAIRDAFFSPNVGDSNGEDANIVDVVNYVSLSLDRVAKAITPTSSVGGQDASGGHVESLTEAVMGITGGLMAVASAIESLANSVEYSARKEKS